MNAGNSCDCFLPRREDCERLGFPAGCYHAENIVIDTTNPAAANLPTEPRESGGDDRDQGVRSRWTNITMDYSRASRENTHTVQRMRMEKSQVA